MLLESTNFPTRQRLYDKYRPVRLDEVIVSPHTRIDEVRSFLADPYPAAWLFTGAPGLGKTSVARIVASQLAHHTIHIRQSAGNDVDVHVVRDMERELNTRPLFGGFNVCVIDEADSISAGASVRLLACLDNLQYGVVILTSNDSTENFDDRLRSRLLHVPFSAHGLATKAICWLREIALKEGINLSESEADAIVRKSKSNLRECLKHLESRTLSLSNTTPFSTRVPAPSVRDVTLPI